jgi:hypothetical protein
MSNNSSLGIRDLKPENCIDIAAMAMVNKSKRFHVSHDATRVQAIELGWTGLLVHMEERAVVGVREKHSTLSTLNPKGAISSIDFLSGLFSLLSEARAQLPRYFLNKHSKPRARYTALS